MIRKLLLVLIIFAFTSAFGLTQSFIRTSDLFKRSDANSNPGQLNFIQDSAIDTLINRYIQGNQNLKKEYTHYGMEGFRIQIYSSSDRNAKIESSKADAEFLSKFPESEFPNLRSYVQFAPPAYYKTRVGDFRTKTEATRLYLIISKEFPEAYLVPDFINFPDLNTK
jgi:hypothetical protein